MITKFLTEVKTRLNPFQGTPAITARLFLAQLPAAARRATRVSATVLPRGSGEGATLGVRFKDGREMEMDLERMSVRDVVEEVDRHSRLLARKEELAGN